MLSKQCSQCACIFSMRDKLCPNCGQKVSTLLTLKSYIENSRLRLALFTICLLLFVGLGWFVRAQTGSRFVLFFVFFVVAPFVPWILKVAYSYAVVDNEDDSEDKENDKT